MSSVAKFHTPEEAAIDLELPLLSTVPAPSDREGPVAASFPEDEASRRAYRRAADRVLLAPGSAHGVIGILGDVSPAFRARVAANLAASIATERTAILVDGDLRGAFLSFDPQARAEEGLTDVLRFGVRSPRVVAPTQAPGLSLLPVGSDTVDYAGTYGSDSAGALFAELRRTGELVLVNGPDPQDLESAEPFLEHVSGWVLLHDMDSSEAPKTRRLLDLIGRERCLGLLATESRDLVAKPSGAAGERAARQGPGVPRSALETAAAGRSDFDPDVFHRSVPAPTSSEIFRDVPGAASPEVFEASAEPAMASFVEPDQAGEDAFLEEDGRRGGLFQVLMGVGVAAILVVAFFFFRESSRRGGAGDLRPVLEADRGAPDSAAETLPGADREAKLPSPAEEAPGQLVGEESRAGLPSETPPLREELPPRESPAAPPKVEAASPLGASSASPGRELVKQTPAQSPQATTATVSGEYAYLVHISSLKTEATARIEAARIEKAGYPTIVRKEDVSGKGTWFRVYAGPYGERLAATNAAAEIRRAGVSDYTQVQRVTASKLETGTGREDR